jgi:branched-chain amino acid transport system substrate-binding protein
MLSALALTASVAPDMARAEPPSATIAVQSSLTGGGAFSGKALVEAIRFAVDRANTAGAGPHINLVVYDDGGVKDAAQAIAQKIADSDALLVLGPALSDLAIATCPIYAEKGVPVIVATAHADAITKSATCHRTVISTGDIGAAVAEYLGRVMHAKKARLIYVDNSYGQPLAERFRAVASQLKIDANIVGFKTAAERDDAAQAAIDDPEQPPVMLGMATPDASPLLIKLRRADYRGAIFGTATMARASFPGEFANQPEEKQQRGYFTDGVYATSPIIPDSANAATSPMRLCLKRSLSTSPRGSRSKPMVGQRWR